MQRGSSRDGLPLDELPEDALRYEHEVVVAAHFGDLAIVDDGNLVGRPDGGQAVGDGQHRPVHHQALQGILNQKLALRIQCAVKNI